MARHVRGSLFADYVRMIRHQKDVDWGRHLSEHDLAFTMAQVEPEGWYAMDVFERLGTAILTHGHDVTLESVRLFGKLSVQSVVALYPALIKPSDPMESLMRLKVLRATLFDFPAFDIPVLSNGHAKIVMSYRMGPVAEEAASYQSEGFCEGVVALAGGTDVQAQFRERAWEKSERTLLDLQWDEP